MAKRRETESQASAPGAFMPDGSWNARAQLTDRGQAHRLVETMIRARRTGDFTPGDAAQMIHSAHMESAFPCWQQWASSSRWFSVLTSTSSEEAVKRAGRGEAGHWCGEEWARGGEKLCGSAGHRTLRDRSMFDQIVKDMRGKFGW